MVKRVTRGGSRISQGRVSNPSETGTGGRASKAPRGMGVWEQPSLPENFCISYIKMVSFYALPVIFIDAVLYKKGHPNQKGGCPNTLDAPLDPHLEFDLH